MTSIPAFTSIIPINTLNSNLYHSHTTKVFSRPTCVHVRVSVSGSLTAKRANVVPELRRDLLRQYEEPRKLDWELYDRSVTFDDPMTQLSGRVQYKVRYIHTLPPSISYTGSYSYR